MFETPTEELIIPQQSLSESYPTEEHPVLVVEHFKRHPDQAVKPEARECGPEVEKLEELMTAFEAKHSLPELYAITELTPKEAETHPIRRPAWRDEGVIVDLVEKIRKETNISQEKLDELQMRRRRISNAVGYIRNNRVEHDR